MTTPFDPGVDPIELLWGGPPPPPAATPFIFQIMPSATALIYDAALRLWIEFGYMNTGVRDIARESGQSMGSIYHRFESKAVLFASLWQEWSMRYRNSLLRLIPDPRTSHDAHAQ